MSRVIAIMVVGLVIAHTVLPSNAQTGGNQPGEEQTVPNAVQPSIDKQLLDDLNSDLLEGLDDLPSKPSVDKPATAPQPGGESRVDQQLRQQLGAGEDIGSSEPADPLTRIGQRMRTVEDLIAKQNTSDNTQQLQQQIVSELAELIVQVQKQCSSGQASRQPPRGSSQPMPQPQPRSGNPQVSQRPAAESTTDLRKPEDAVVDATSRQALLKEVWGHLPERVRQQMQNSLSEQFLPKYEKLIEEYYKRLAEQQENYP